MSSEKAARKSAQPAKEGFTAEERAALKERVKELKGEREGEAAPLDQKARIASLIKKAAG